MLVRVPGTGSGGAWWALGRQPRQAGGGHEEAVGNAVKRSVRGTKKRKRQRMAVATSVRHVRIVVWLVER